MHQNPEFEIKLIDISNRQELDQLAQVVNTAFKRQTVSKKDCDTITTQELITKNPVIPKEIISLQKENEIIGSVILHLPVGIPIAYFSHLAILPAFQGQKLGEKLMRFAERQAAETYAKKQLRINLVYHPADPQKGLTKYYEKQGYEFLFEEKPSQKQLTKLFLPEYHDKIIIKYLGKDLG